MNKDEMIKQIDKVLAKYHIVYEAQEAVEIADAILAAQSEQICCDYSDCKEPVYAMLCKKHYYEIQD
jgi:hypothetical protein